MNYKAHPSFKVPENSTRIWRYVSYARFEQLVKSKELWLPRIDQFSDFKEGGLSARQIYEADEELAAQGMPVGFGGAVMAYFEQFVNHRSWYAVCWNASEYESNLMWRSYGAPKRQDTEQFKIAIQSTVGALRAAIPEEIQNMYIHEVAYRNQSEGFEDDGGGSRISGDSVFRKDVSYHQENEIRMAIEKNDFASGILADLPETPIGSAVPLRINDLIQSVYIEAIPMNPKKLALSDIWSKEEAESYLQTLKDEEIRRFNLIASLLREAGCTGQSIIQSSTL